MHRVHVIGKIVPAEKRLLTQVTFKAMSRVGSNNVTLSCSIVDKCFFAVVTFVWLFTLVEAHVSAKKEQEYLMSALSEEVHRVVIFENFIMPVSIFHPAYSSPQRMRILLKTLEISNFQSSENSCRERTCRI